MSLLGVASFLVLGGLLVLKRSGFQSVPVFLERLFPAKIYRQKSFVVDGLMFGTNKCISLFLLSFVFWGPGEIYEFLPHAAGSKGVSDSTIGLLFGQSFIAGGVLLVTNDFFRFFSHWLRHRLPSFWAFHKVHHSALTLSPFTGGRSHPLELIFLYSFVFLGQFLTLALLVVSGVPVEIGVGSWIIVYSLNDIFNNFRHSHIYISFGPVLSYIFVSPAMHQIHHSTMAAHQGKNFGFIFSFWDAFFGTLYVPEREQSLQLGIREDDASEGLVNYGDLIRQPIQKVLRAQS